MTQSDYVLWMPTSKVPYACMLGSIQNVSDRLELNDGVPRQENFPKDAEYRMDPEFPNDRVLTDSLININRLIVGSARLKQFLEMRHLSNMEYLPVSIRDHQGGVASRDYFIINPIHPVDALDIEKCDVEWGLLLPDRIDGLARLVLVPEKVPADRELFRLKAFSLVTLVRRDLAQEIDRMSFTGIRWLELKDFPEI